MSLFISESQLLLRLGAAFILGGAVGLERESAQRPAGFRTHTLVSVGAALVMVLSESIAGADPARLAAQVVSGIGFLGAGTILREGPTVRGLTTAASLWVVAAIGLACGAGFFEGAGLAAALVMIALVPLVRLERWVGGKRERKVLELDIEDRPGQLGRIGQVLGRLGVSIKGIQMEEATARGRLNVALTVRFPPGISVEAAVAELSEVEGVHAVMVDE
ncbi:MAG: putative Mg2+ transporter-C (MgtC) family protein [Bacillota bacterium]|nr:putative Mg2+ transporter-C (MgtC) family protein [Bacillota bacterium]MDK2855528.1 putative Mg2+ transporter-C (MgtC) family protein [Bacillota bacterium]MDK2925467.1 putative Mg2+ transporter-C (MgtC) family protein [Bacillota bacterium]